MSKKKIINRINKRCVCCGRKIKVILYKDGTYRGGHYFGKFPLYTKEELEKACKAGTVKEKIGGLELNVLKKEPKPYDYAEYWECPKCYWQY